MMAVAAWLVWRPAGFIPAKVPLLLFAVQLALNVAWYWISFGLHWHDWAFVEIVILWAAIAVTMRAFFQQSQLAGWLLVPFLAWVSFATVLNFAIWQLDQGPNFYFSVRLSWLTSRFHLIGEAPFTKQLHLT